MTDDGYKPKLTRNEYLQAFALFTMANAHSRKAYEFEWAMNRIVRPWIGDFGGGYLGDAIHSTEASTAELFDEALKRTGIESE